MVSPTRVSPLTSNVPIADKNGNPTPFFARQLKQLLDEKADVAAVADAAIPSDQLLAQLLADLGGDPADDRIIYWDDSTNTFKFLDIGANLSISSNTLNTSGGGGGSYEGIGNLESLSGLTPLSGSSANITLTNGTKDHNYSWTSSGLNRLQLADKATPATPFTYYLRMTTHQTFAVNVQFGLVLRNSTSGKCIVFGYNNDNALNVQEWTNTTTFSSTITTKSSLPSFFLRPLWLRVTSDGTTLTFYFSSNGIDWTLHTTRTIATFLGSIDRVGLGGVPMTAANVIISNFGTTTPA